MGPPPLLGDVRVFDRSDGGTRTAEVIEVTPWKAGWHFVVLTEETGLGTAVVEQFALPGKKLLIGNASSGDLVVAVRKPKTLMKLKARLGRTYRARVPAQAFFSGSWVGKAHYVGAWTFSGIEPIATPADSYGDTVRLDQVLGLAILDAYTGDLIESIVEQTAWYARGLGIVSNRQRTVGFLNGVQMSDTGFLDAWLVSGVIGGVPYP